MKPVDEGAVENIVHKYHDRETLAPNRQVELLADIFSLLPAVKEVEVIEGSESTLEDDPPEFFTSCLRELGQGQDAASETKGMTWDRCPLNRNATQAIIRAMPQLSPMCHTLKSRGMETSKSAYVCPRERSILSLLALRQLEMTFRLREPALFGEEYLESEDLGYVSLADALSRASDLQQLQLQGVGRYGGPGTYGDGRENVIKLLVRGGTIFRRLQCLSIQDTPMDDGYLSKFLYDHCGTLKRLVLKNIILVHRRKDVPHECLVGLLQSIRAMRLESVSFGGLTANGGNQIWHFEDRYDFRSQLADFIHDRNQSFKSAVNRWACGNPGYGVHVGGLRYPSTEHSRWFDKNAVAVIEQWVLDRELTRSCPMEQFSIQSGKCDYLPSAEEGRGFRWHAYVWSEEDWFFRYAGRELEAG